MLGLFVAVCKMVNSCAAIHCTNKRGKTAAVKFHKFPHEDRSLCDQWIAAAKRDASFPKVVSYICGDHFTAEDYDEDGKLRSNVVPSVFKTLKNRRTRMRGASRVRRSVSSMARTGGGIVTEGDEYSLVDSGLSSCGSSAASSRKSSKEESKDEEGIVMMQRERISFQKVRVTIL